MIDCLYQILIISLSLMLDEASAPTSAVAIFRL